jgi:carbamoyltransferase
MQKNLNLKVKFRESFRPFAPIILAEFAEEYFNLPEPSPYMLIARKIAESKRSVLPDGFATLSPEEKLRLPKSELSAATHVDYSCRIQTVHKEVSPRLWKLLNAFYQRTNCPALINTSFNVKDEPIVNTPEDAYRCFMRTGIDHLVIGNVLVSK